MVICSNGPARLSPYQVARTKTMHHLSPTSRLQTELKWDINEGSVLGLCTGINFILCAQGAAPEGILPSSGLAYITELG